METGQVGASNTADLGEGGGGKSMGNVGMMRTSDLREEKNDRLTPIHRNLELM